jgi:hypothetical protein
MNRRNVLSLSAIAAFGLALFIALSPSFAQQNQFGSATEAKEMLERVITELKANESAAIEKFHNGAPGFRDRDLYVLCFNTSDGKIVSHIMQALMGMDVKALKDATGKVFGQELFDAAKENLIIEVAYMFPRPGSDEPVQKVSYVTKVGNIGCGVGHYK